MGRNRAAYKAGSSSICDYPDSALSFMNRRIRIFSNWRNLKSSLEPGYKRGSERTVHRGQDSEDGEPARGLSMIISNYISAVAVTCGYTNCCCLNLRIKIVAFFDSE